MSEVQQSIDGLYQDPSLTMPGFRYNHLFSILMM
jgi:hypothetical protein